MKRYLWGVFFMPGVILHELGHLIFCVLSGVRVHAVKLFGFGVPSGYVEHEEPHSLPSSILISFGPLTLNSMVSLVLFSRINFYFDLPQALLWWVGVVSAVHALPSGGDANALIAISKQKLRRNPLALIGFPFAAVIYILDYLKKFHLQFLYAALLFWLGNIYLK